jgi:ABC-2 type transport system permease protein
MTRALRAELFKLRTTRTALGFLVAGVLLTLLIVLIGILAGDPQSVAEKRATISVGHTLSALLLLFGVVGATAEYRHRTTAAVALIVPSRLRLSVARMLAYGFAGLLVAAVLLVLAFAIGIPLLQSRHGPPLATSDYLRAVGGTLLASALGTMLGVAIGVLVANQVAAVIGTLVFIFIAEPLITAASSSFGKFLFGDALATVGGNNADHQLAFGGAIAVSVAWTVGALAVAAFVDARRDIG